jgi:beta-ureidopropionase / N-carbamoyl-L-amino-acid hydrolase
LPIGVVTSVVGIRTLAAHFYGRPDHAGTTPMAMREDASAQMFDFVAAMRAGLEDVRGDHTVWNFGGLRFSLGASNVVPAEVELMIQYRDSNGETLRNIDALVERSLTVASTSGRAPSLRKLMTTEPVLFDEQALAEIEAAAASIGAVTMRIPSGAGHDAAVINRRVPSSMMFIPSIRGRSHCPEENTHEADILTGADVALNAANRMIQSEH